MRPFYDRLPPDRREALFEAMRRMDDESTRFFASGRETPNTIPVGAALFDETLRGAARLELLMALRKAETLEQAFEQARESLRVWVRRHNEKRPRDRAWQRWEGSGQSELEFLISQIRRVVNVDLA